MFIIIIILSKWTNRVAVFLCVAGVPTKAFTGSSPSRGRGRSRCRSGVFSYVSISFPVFRESNDYDTSLTDETARSKNGNCAFDPRAACSSNDVFIEGNFLLFKERHNEWTYMQHQRNILTTSCSHIRESQSTQYNPIYGSNTINIW